MLEPLDLTFRLSAARITMMVASILAMAVNRAEAEQAEEGPVAVAAITRHGDIVLKDDRRLCLAGLRVPVDRDGAGAEVRRALDGLIGGRSVRFASDSSAPYDRYGCLTATVWTADGRSLQHALLERGLAMVRILPDSVRGLDAMLAVEDRARRARRGVWSRRGAQPRAADDLDGLIGTVQIVEGRVRRVSDNERYAYLNFGADWRTDFTVRLDRTLIESGGLDLAGLEGKTLRVRGLVQEARGPLIDISHLAQIEILP